MSENFLTKQDGKLITKAYMFLNISFVLSLISFLVYSIFNIMVTWNVTKQFDAQFCISVLYILTFCSIITSCFAIIRAIIRACENIAKIKFISVEQLNKEKD